MVVGVSRVGKDRFGAPGRIRTCAPASGGRDPPCARASVSVLQAALGGLYGSRGSR